VPTRRDFIKATVKGGLGLISTFFISSYEPSRFNFCQIIYRGNWDPRPRASRRLLSSLDIRTSVRVSFDRKTLNIADPDLFLYPFLYLAGDREFDPFTDKERKRLRRFLRLGGTILIDDTSGEENSTFDTQIREEIREILPEYPLKQLPREHVIFKSFYLLHSASGRKMVKPYLEGVTFEDEDRTSIIYSRNDLGGAWSEDEFGRWQYECIPGGEAQRELAFRLGINIVVYVLTGNYKKDQIHTPFIRQREMSL
jgi:hypothetical protein